MSDYISREETYKILCEEYPLLQKEHLKRVIDKVPSAQPERKKGKWIFYERREPQYDLVGTKTWANAYRCSECGFLHTVIEDFGHYLYCPSCGADMRGEEDGRIYGTT